LKLFGLIGRWRQSGWSDVGSTRGISNDGWHRDDFVVGVVFDGRLVDKVVTDVGVWVNVSIGHDFKLLVVDFC
jgi:hypothetical protein